MEGFEYLMKLKTLKLQGNKIDKSKNVIFKKIFFDQFGKFKCLNNLQKLSFQEVNGNGMNPICKIPNYRSEICKIFSSVKTLDGIKKEYDVKKKLIFLLGISNKG